MDRIKRLSYEVLDGHKSKFGEDFASNKKVLDQISIIRSKGLKNEMAGYITKFIKREIREEKAKQAQRTIAQEEVVSEDELTVDENIDVDKTEDVVVEASESDAESDENSE
ncbi:MAG: 40S ribosomal protein S17 [Nitrosarchaeum sp.]|nr:40S ribosomal protein S17 [Nitrosarchaeum sp.]